MASTASKVFALAALSLVITPIAQAGTERHRFSDPSRVPSITEPANLKLADYMVLAPSAPTSGPDALWVADIIGCNTVRVAVSNVGAAPGPQTIVTLNVYHSSSGSAGQATTSYRQRVPAIDADDHIWVDFEDVLFAPLISSEGAVEPTVNIQMEAFVEVQDANQTNNTNARSEMIPIGSCSR